MEKVLVGERKIIITDGVVVADYIMKNARREVVGEVKILHYCLYKSTEVEYRTCQEHQGKGYATKSLKIVLEDFFRTRPLDGITYLNAYGKAEKTVCDKISLQISRDNIGSVKVASRNGFNISKHPYGFSGEISKEKFLNLTKNSEREFV